MITCCRERLAIYKAPAAIDFVPALPKSATGKVLKRVLRQQARLVQPVGWRRVAGEARAAGQATRRQLADVVAGARMGRSVRQSGMPTAG